MTTVTMVYLVTFRANNASPQQEAKFYTPQAAEIFSAGIQQAGGVAIVTEDATEDTPDNDSDNVLSTRSTLRW